MTKTSISQDQIKHIARLSNLTPQNTSKLNDQFSETLNFVNELQELNTHKIQPTPQVTNLQNVYRSDEIDTSRQLSQDQALSNAKKTYQGYFVVPQLISS